MMPLVILLVWIPCLLVIRVHGTSHLRHRLSRDLLDKADAKYWERLLQVEGYVLEILPPDENNANVVDGSIGSDCFVDEDCDFDFCVFDPPATDAPGRCTCNPDFESGDGCEGDFECKTPEEIGEAVDGLVSVANVCKLPVGATCDPERPTDCLTEVCDSNTFTCVCNVNTGFPCKKENNEICLLNDNGSYVCAQAPTGPPSNDCPEPNPETLCTLEYLPVNCGGCEYGNQCFATSADPTFTKETCALVNPPDLPPEDCPEPNPETSCTLEYLPVDCGGCEYGNQCAATSADPSFTEEMCTLVNLPVLPPEDCPKPNTETPCTPLYLPVNCGGCEYGNQCDATSADASFTEETCTLVNPPDLPKLYQSCGGIAGIPCEDDSLICYTGNSNDCDEDCGAADCLGACRQVVEGEKCGGGAAFGFQCPEGTECVDEKGDGCSPNCGDADCMGICLVV